MQNVVFDLQLLDDFLGYRTTFTDASICKINLHMPNRTLELDIDMICKQTRYDGIDRSQHVLVKIDFNEIIHIQLDSVILHSLISTLKFDQYTDFTAASLFSAIGAKGEIVAKVIKVHSIEMIE